MRSGKAMTWAVILAVAAGAWFLSSHLDQLHQDEEAQANRLLPPEEIMAARVLELKGLDYPEPLRLERGGQGQEGWRLTRPLEYPADGLAVGRMLTGLSQARISRRLVSPSPLADYGLEPPRLDLALTGPQGQASRLLVGDLSPSGESVYLARPGETEVLLAPAELRASLARGLLDLRDKAALEFPVDQVIRVELASGGQELVLERGEGGWLLKGHGPADPGEVENLLFQAHGLLAQGFLDRDFKPAKLGLEPPRNRLLLNLAGGGQRGLAWGARVEGKNQVYARRLEGGPLLLLRDESLARLQRQPQDLLDRRLFTLEPSAVEGMEIAAQGRRAVYARQQGQWRRLEPPGEAAAGQEAERLLGDLLDLKWDKPLPAARWGQEKPVVGIAVWPKDGPRAGQALELGQADPQSGLLAARRPGRPEIYGLKADILDKIPREAAPPAAAQAEQGH